MYIVDDAYKNELQIAASCVMNLVSPYSVWTNIVRLVC
jgi:hypothetical protein